MKAAENEDVVIIKEQTACFTGHREMPALQLISLRRKLKNAEVKDEKYSINWDAGSW